MGRALALLALMAWLPAAELRLSGVIGQSEPPTATPLAVLGFAGVAVDAAGRLWGAAGDRLLRVDDGVTVAAAIVLPAGIRSPGGLARRGDRLLAPLADGRLAVVDPAAGRIERLLPLPPGTTRVHCPAQPGPGAGRFLAVVLAGRQLLGLPEDGSAAVAIATLPELPGTWVEAVGVLAGGDVVVGTGYPDMRQYRLAMAAGHWVNAAGWPRPGWPRQYLRVGEATWMLGHDGAVALVDGASDGRPPLPAQATGQPHHGAVATNDGWWTASARGLVLHAPDGRPLRRLGGLPGLAGVAATGDGALLALLGGGLVVRLGQDDGPTGVPSSPDEQAWHIGHGWTGRASALAGERDGALLLDASAGALWRFEPERARWGDHPWTAAAPAGTLAAAGALAVGDCRVLVVAGGRLLEADRRTLPLALAAVALPDATAVRVIACDGDDRLYAATAGEVAACARGPGGFARRWAVPAPGVVALATLPGLVATATERRIVLLAAADGHPLAELDAEALPGRRLRVTGLAAQPPWLLVADADGCRVLRLRVVHD
ncbi:MAG: hypothetical protein L6R48_05770 [Planctomycetes bacterium]|nr:hypothetical protein [Planctomycetota bacterium]